MFQYNRFWHFWFELNNRHYLKSFSVSLVISLILIQPAVLFPPLWVLVVALPLVVSGTIALFTQLSTFFYNRQNQRLTQLKADTPDEALKKDIDLYLNRRVICPKELLAGVHLSLPHESPKMEKAAANTPLIFETEDTLVITKALHDIYRRNSAVKATSASNQLYVKTVAAKDGLSEVAAREMAEILGFGGLIPSNTIAKTDVLNDDGDGSSMPNTGLVLSRQKISALIDKRREESPEKDIKNSPGVQNALAKALFNLKTAAYRAKAQRGEDFKLLHVQKLMPNAVDGQHVYTRLFNEPVVLPGPFVLGGLTESEKRTQRAEAKAIVQEISLPSFQENFLLHLILGSQDANPGNTLFTKGQLHSIDHERIMPEDNYNITKRIPLGNGPNHASMVEKNIKNVFPIRLWLAGLPQADVPFTKEIIAKALESLNPERLLAYHRQKKLFSDAAVGAQLDRILLIKNVFEAEIKKSDITLTPKEVFLKLIKNHPTYMFLKNEVPLSDFHTFALLGLVPEGADIGRHPLQWPSLGRISIEAAVNQKEGRPPFSEEDFKSSDAHHVLFFSVAASVKTSDMANKSALDMLTEISSQLSSK